MPKQLAPEVNHVTLEAKPNLSFRIKAELFDENGQPLKVQGTNQNAVLIVGPNQTSVPATLTSVGKVLVKISSADGRAAAAANSQYVLTFNEPFKN